MIPGARPRQEILRVRRTLSKLRGMSPFVNAQSLRDDIYHGRRQKVLGVFWEPGEGAGYLRFKSEHLPTALFCDPAQALAGVPSSEDGRNPLPEPHNLQAWFRRWGLADDTRVVVYDDGRGVMAARAWWVLRWAGMDNVQILDGGLRAWDSLNLPIVGGPGNFAAAHGGTVRAGSLPVAGIDDVRGHLDGVLVDARGAPRFAGHREVLDLKAGHIPGAVNIPATDLYDEDRKVRGPEEIRARFAREGISSGEGVIVYSGSGHHSAMLLAAMEHADMGTARHYLGGWSQWSADSANPVERGFEVPPAHK